MGNNRVGRYKKAYKGTTLFLHTQVRAKIFKKKIFFALFLPSKCGLIMYIYYVYIQCVYKGFGGWI